MASYVEEVKDSVSSSNRGYIAVKPSVSYEEIATKLLNEKLLLTALELYAELCESGREIPILRDFFANPNNFENHNVRPEPYTPMPRSSSQATLDSLDMTRYSEDGAGVDERVAILEFELRKARENISALRANLTVVAETEGATPDKHSDKNSTEELPIKPHEQRALNFLVNEYLLAHSYKLTSITFSDENEDQDFEDWEDVGLNIPKPSGILQIYREYMKMSGYDKPPSANIAVQTDFDSTLNEVTKEEFNQAIEDREQLKQQVLLLEQEKLDLQNIISSTVETLSHNPEKQGSNITIQSVNSNSTSPDKFELLESLPREASIVTEEPEEEDSVSAVVSLGETDPGDKEWTKIQIPRVDVTGSSITQNPSSRNLPLKFKMEVLTQCLINISTPSASSIEESLRGGVTNENIIEILTQSLHRIVPYIVLNKREEAIPLILSAVCLHTDSNEREKLLQLLFNLRKQPQEDKRQAILAGLIAIAKVEDSSLDEEEVLTTCWEQSQNKYIERRLLAVECCSALAPYASPSIRNSLMLSMLQQMLLDDKDASVRSTVVKSLALLIALIDDSDKYFQYEELALTALYDSSSEVVDTASSILLPVLGQWALSLGRLQTHLLPRIISKLKNQLKPSQHSPSKDHIDETRVIALIKVLQYLLPHTVVCVANTDTVKAFVEDGMSSDLREEFMKICNPNIINPKIFYDGDMDVESILNTFFANTWERDTWPELNWVTDKLIPDITEMMKMINITQENILNSLLVYINYLCIGFGRYIVQTRIQPLFMPEISELENELTTLSTERKNINLTLIPCYLVILSTLSGTEVSKSLKQFMIALSLSGTNIGSLQISINMLCTQESMQEFVLTSLWDGVVHQRPVVRCTAAVLFGVIVGNVPDQLVNARVTPAIVTLVNDPEIVVRTTAIPVLGKLITECKIKEVQDKARLTLGTIASDPQGVPQGLLTTLVSTFVIITPHSPQSYIEDVIAKYLLTACTVLQQNRKTDLISALIEAYSVLLYCPLNNQCVLQVILPGLKQLEIIINQHLPHLKETIRSLLREAESRQDIPKSIDRSTSLSSGLSLSMATANVGQGVEDMRQRMSRIFHQKANSTSMSSIFRKK